MFFWNTLSKNNPSLINDTTNCAWYYAAPYFLLTLLLIIMLIISYYKSTKYIKKTAIVADIQLSVYMNTPPPYTMTSHSPLQGEANYQYKIEYEHNGKTYNAIIEKVSRKMNIGDPLDIVIVKQNPNVIKTKTDFSDMLLVFSILTPIFVAYCFYLRILLMSHMGRTYLCANGIISSITNLFNNKKMKINT